MLVEAVGVLATLVAVISFPILKLGTSLSAIWNDRYCNTKTNDNP